MFTPLSVLEDDSRAADAVLILRVANRDRVDVRNFYRTNKVLRQGFSIYLDRRICIRNKTILVLLPWLSTESVLLIPIRAEVITGLAAVGWDKIGRILGEVVTDEHATRHIHLSIGAMI